MKKPVYYLIIIVLLSVLFLRLQYFVFEADRILSKMTTLAIDHDNIAKKLLTNDNERKKIHYLSLERNQNELVALREGLQKEISILNFYAISILSLSALVIAIMMLKKDTH